jgi:CBS domain-containing protein
MTKNLHSEEIHVSGDELISKIKELVHEGNIRRVIIKNENGHALIDIPLSLGVVGVLLAPQLAAVGAIAALITKGTIIVEKEDA